MKRIIIFGIVLFFYCGVKSQDFNSSNFGKWKVDEDSLPFFELNFHQEQCPWYPFSHFQGTGYNSILTNQWGDVNLFSTEYGLTNITPALWVSRGGFYPTISIKGELISLIISELDSNKLVKYGIGYTDFSGEIHRKDLKLKIAYRIITPFDNSKGFFSALSLTNLSERAVTGELSVNSDLWIKPTYDNVIKWRERIEKSKKSQGASIASVYNIDDNFQNISLIGNQDYIGTIATTTLRLTKKINLKPKESETATFKFCYNEDINAVRKMLKTFNPSYSVQTWKKVLQPLNSIRKNNWMDRENTWTYSQLLSMCFYDKSLEENFIHLGGYGIGENPASPGTGFTMREIAETAIILSSFNPDLAKSSLRWMAKTQLKSGDLKRAHNHFPLEYENENQRLDSHFPEESDSEIWFLIACGEYFKATKDTLFFKQIVPYRTLNSNGTIWNHMLAAKEFIKNDIGVGKNGLIKMLHGDWNDYLSRIGDKGNGQSLMNTAMMCRALINMEGIAIAFNDSFQYQVKDYLQQLQQAVNSGFDKEWFIRAIDDEGNSVGGYDDRLFINAQSWAALGKCGTREQRKKALLNAVKLCSTPIGMTLISKPYSSPTPSNISWAPIPAGEGENAGIWPQTVAWMVWALAEEGIIDVAESEWKKNTLAVHSNLYPQVPFGIFNGPDCYSSHYAKEREGWTQIEMFSRMIPIPMNPIIAWQSFGLKQIILNSK